MAHAEASAKTVDAAVTAAAAQLGLRSDQVDVEVLEDPVPSTFGYIGSPARVRVTSRATSPSTTSPSTGAEHGEASTGTGIDESAESGSAGGEPEPSGAGTELRPTDHPFAQEPSNEVNVSNDAASTLMAGSASASSPVPAQPATAATETGNGQVLADRSAQAGDQLAVQTQERASSPQEGPGSSESVTGPATGLASSATSDTFEASTPAPSVAPASPTPATAAVPDRPDPPTPVTPTAADPEAATSPSSRSTPEATSSTSSASVPPSATTSEAAPREESGSSARGTRPPRRTYKDEPIEPHMVEEDTERAGDFLEGLLDALDVDGDITTWVDEAGGHIDLEGTDLEVLVGPNGETLDALQELTRLAVLRQSKRRVRLLIDINGFRARQREQLTSMVRATVEQVIRTREDHELQPMSPAERKIVHDAVAAIDGARTESLGEEPNRRVVIRPA